MSFWKLSRTRQPTQPVGVNWTNPLTRGLVHWVTGSDPGSGWAYTNGVGATFGVHGRALSFASASTQHLRNTKAQVTSYPLTFFALARRASLGANHTLVSVGHPSNNSRAAIYIASADNIAMWTANSSGTGAQAIAPGSSDTSTTTYQAYGGRVLSSTYRDVWRNGVLITSDTTNIVVAAEQILVGADLNAGAIQGPHNGDIAIAAAWNRFLSDAEMVALSRNPWQLFAPIERPIWVAVSSSGDINGTLSATLGALTSSATGQLVISGNLSATLGALTASATGNLPIAGQLAATLGALTSTATGNLPISGSLTATLGALTCVAYQTEPGPGPEPEPSKVTPAGRPTRKRKRRQELEIDGEVYQVSSAAEAEEIITAKAKEREELAITRANKANVRPIRKVVADARKTLQKLEIVAPPDLSAEIDGILAKVQQRFEDTLRTIEIGALLRKRQREEEDDEEVLLLL